jgi:hypothetical protein
MLAYSHNRIAEISAYDLEYFSPHSCKIKKLGMQIKLIYDDDKSNKRRNVNFKTSHHNNGFSDFFILDNSL